MFEIVREDDGTRHALGEDFSITVMPDLADTCEVFWRHRLKWPGGRHDKVLVAQLDDVRLYVHGTNLIMTKKRLMGEKKRAT